MIATRGMVPPGGWHYPVEPGVTLTASSHKELCENIFQYRLQHGIPEGNIERDVDRYICSRWPYTCQKESADYGVHQEASGPRVDILTRVTRSTSKLIAAMPQGGYPLVNQPEAEDRAQKCAACPLNVAWRGGCGSCTAQIATLGITIRRHRNTKKDSTLRACSQLGVDLQVLVHLPDGVPPEVEGLTPPPNCWRSK